MGNLKCAFCGIVMKADTFVIGASKEPEWCMIYGTGKLTCPSCYPLAEKDAEEVEREYFKTINSKPVAP